MARLACDDEETVRAADATHRACTLEMFEQFAGDESMRVRAAAAENPSCPPRVQLRLAGDPDMAVRWAAAGNPAAAAVVLARIAAASESVGKLRLLRHPRCGQDLVDVVSGRPRPEGVRVAAAEHPKLGEATLRRLAGDEHHAVRAAIAGPWRLRAGCAAPTRGRSAARAVRCVVAGRADCPERSMEDLAFDQAETVRAAVAGNAACGGWLLAHLAGDAHGDVREAAAANANCPPGTLNNLTADAGAR